MGNSSLQQLLACLADGHIHSGESLGTHLGISRAAVWKQIKVAQMAGVPLRANRGEGYQLETGFEMLNVDAIKQACMPDILKSLADIDILMSVDSTNSQVMRLFQQGFMGPMALLAEKQTAGRGRRGRVWHSPFASSIYLTVGWVFTEGVAALEGLSLIVGLKVVEALQSLGATELQLKWPNDVYWHQRKLAGVLIDVQGDPAGVCQVAIGIGINVNLRDIQSSLIDQPWVDFFTVLNPDHMSAGKQVFAPGNTIVSRNTLAAELLNHLIPALVSLPDKGFAAYQEAWQGYDVCYGHSVTLQSGNTMITGRACGVNSQGAYGIDVKGIDDAGSQSALHYASGGELSLRVNTPPLMGHKA